MSLTKNDFDRPNKRLQSITEQAVDEIEITTDYPPTLDELEDNNITYSIMAAILFIDIRKSTYLSETSQAKSMVKIYRSFMRMAVDCVRKNGGVTRQFTGDRIMGVFLNTYDSNNTVITQKAVDKAIEAARSLQTAIDYSLNRHIKANVNGKTIECGIGIDYGKVLVTQVGMYGVEEDETKGNETSCVWVGKTTNHASKYCDLAEGSEIFISESVYNSLSNCYKEKWVESAKYRGSTVFQGYTASHYYLDYVDQLGTPVTSMDESPGSETFSQLAEGIHEIERLQTALIKREREIAVLEAHLKEENKGLKENLRKAEEARNIANSSLKNTENELYQLKWRYYNFIHDIIYFAHCKPKYIEAISYDLWVKIIAQYYKIGKETNHAENDITRSVDCSLIQIYSYYEKYRESYDAMVLMAELNPVWIYWDTKTISWAQRNFVLLRLQHAIESRLINNTVDIKNRPNFEEALRKVKQLRGE